MYKRYLRKYFGTFTVFIDRVMIKFQKHRLINHTKTRTHTISLKYFVPHIFVYTIDYFNILSTCKYFQVPVDPQVFDSQLRVTWWLKPARIQV
jgi:hypothetical protein